MADKDDFLIQEVNEELKAERLRQWWERFGSWIAGLCVVLVLGTSGYVYWKNQRQEANEQMTAALLSTNEAIDRKQYNSAATQLLALPEQAGGVTLLARLKAAHVLEQDSRMEKSREQFEIVAAARDEAALAHYAKLRLQEYASPKDAPFAPLAAELQAISLYDQGKKKEARALLQGLTEDTALPRSAQQRAQELLAAFR